MTMKSDRVTKFKLHFENVLNPDGVYDLDNVYTNVTISVLDDRVTSMEVEPQIPVLKVDKTCGPGGLLRASSLCFLPSGL